MQIQINTDRNITGDTRLSETIEAELRNSLARFSDQITRIELHLRDENSATKSGSADKRCLLEVRLAGQNPVTTQDTAEHVMQAVTGAAEKMVRLLETQLGKLSRH
ncbi:HPF/RaiA family ribosome-associated protein [Halopseudomonas phragmitis]|uniref:Ribosomal subunit interface protein n=2 Tax=Pseudomonadaceae TaxID=135621 RepID=A0A1V0B7T7_9GAMM|nr:MULTISPECIES: HPF/RaiA family ribosome-associated protein [Pseudomonadaceae]AQZ95996.1 hypothetical protein BVH74_15100 [Halopseudomonas phragmitis]RHW21181.1 hypothetical protein C2846_10675 [Pseudomonas jilinensis]